MVAKKTSKPAKKSTAASAAKSKKPAAKKPPAKKAAAKTVAAKKAPAKKAAAKKAPAKKAAAKSADAPVARADKPEKTEKAASGVRSTDVVLAHLFALRPRVATSFKPDDFRQAKQLLEDESYANTQEAARAVAEKALELTGSGLPKRRKRR